MNYNFISQHRLNVFCIYCDHFVISYHNITSKTVNTIIDSRNLSRKTNIALVRVLFSYNTTQSVIVFAAYFLVVTLRSPRSAPLLCNCNVTVN